MSDDGISVEITAVVDQFQNAMASAIGSLGLFEAAADTAGVVVAGMFTKDAISGALSFDDALARVQTRANLSSVDMASLATGITTLGSTMSGALFSHEELATAMGSVAREGRSVSDMLAIETAAVHLAVATRTDLSSAVELVDQNVSALGGNATDAAHIADVLTVAWQKSGGSLSELSANLVATSQTAQTFGLSLDATAASLTLLAEHGGSVRGLQSALEAMLRPTQQTKTVFDELHVSLTDATGAMRPVVDVLSDINAHAAETGLTSQQVGQLMNEAFGVQGGKAVGILLGNLDDLKTHTDAFATSAGVAENASNAMATTPQDKVQKLKSDFSNLTSEVGLALVPAFLVTVDAVSSVVSWLQQNSDVLEVVAGAVVAATVAYEAFTFGMWLANGAVGATILAEQAMAVVTGILEAELFPLIATIGLVTIAAVGIYEAWKHWDDIKAIADRIWPYLEAGLRVLLAVMTGGLSELVIYVVQHFDEIRDAAAHLPQAIVDGLGDIGSYIWNHIAGGLHNVASNVTQWARGVIGLSPTLIEIGGYIPQSLADGVSANASVFQDGVSTMLHNTAETAAARGRETRAAFMDGFLASDSSTPVADPFGGVGLNAWVNHLETVQGDFNQVANGQVIGQVPNANGSIADVRLVDRNSGTLQAFGQTGTASFLERQLGLDDGALRHLLTSFNVPFLASGGIVNSPTLAMIGEAGPEAVVPLSKLGGGSVQVNVTISAKDDLYRVIAANVEAKLLDDFRAHGLA